MKLVRVFGDSHTAFLGQPSMSVKNNLPALHEEFVKLKELIVQKYEYHYLGAQLAYNFHSKVLPEVPCNFDSVLDLFYLGEIDIRVHFVIKRNARMVANIYFEQIILHQSIAHCDVGIILPPSPADFGFKDPNYPKNGSLEEREEAHFEFCRELRNLAAANNVLVISFIDSWGIETTQSLSVKESDDGCHLNMSSNELLKQKMFQLLNW